MKVNVLLEYYRQFGFVSSVLSGFAFTFFGVLLPVSTRGRSAALAAFLAVAGSIALLLVTLGMTFAAAVAASLPSDAVMPDSILAQQTPLSFCFIAGVLFAGEFRGRWLDPLAFYGYRDSDPSGRRGIRHLPCSHSFSALMIPHFG